MSIEKWTDDEYRDRARKLVGDEVSVEIDAEVYHTVGGDTWVNADIFVQGPKSEVNNIFDVAFKNGDNISIQENTVDAVINFLRSRSNNPSDIVSIILRI